MSLRNWARWAAYFSKARISAGGVFRCEAGISGLRQAKRAGEDLDRMLRLPDRPILALLHRQRAHVLNDVLRRQRAIRDDVAACLLDRAAEHRPAHFLRRA